MTDLTKHYRVAYAASHANPDDSIAADAMQDAKLDLLATCREPVGYVLFMAAEERDTLVYWLRHGADMARDGGGPAGEANAQIDGINSMLMQLDAELEKHCDTP